MTDPKKTGLPEDLGNGMSDRAGYYDESPSGSRETPLGNPTTDTTQPDAVPDSAGGRPHTGDSGTSFDTTLAEDKRQ